MVNRTTKEWLSWCNLITKGYVPEPGGKLATYKSGIEYFNKKLLPLNLWKPNDFILEIGCGNGRIPMALVNEPISYLGLEPIPASFEFCQQAFQDYPDFQFKHLDVRNTFFHPEGLLDPENVVLPVEDESVNVVLLASVFTHMETKRAASHYLDEIKRVLKLKGLVFSTWFRSPPNTATSDTHRTVYNESWITEQISQRFDIQKEMGGTTTKFHDQWEIVAVRKI